MTFRSRNKKKQHSCCYVFGLWQSLSSEVILENSKLPDGVTIAYTSHCKNGVVSEGENGRKCSNISIGDEVRNSEWLFVDESQLFSVFTTIQKDFQP